MAPLRKHKAGGRSLYYNPCQRCRRTNSKCQRGTTIDDPSCELCKSAGVECSFSATSTAEPSNQWESWTDNFENPSSNPESNTEYASTSSISSDFPLPRQPQHLLQAQYEPITVDESRFEILNSSRSSDFPLPMQWRTPHVSWGDNYQNPSSNPNSNAEYASTSMSSDFPPPMQWGNAHVSWGDDYQVPSSNPNSNAEYAGTSSISSDFRPPMQWGGIRVSRSDNYQSPSSSNPNSNAEYASTSSISSDFIPPMQSQHRPETQCVSYGSTTIDPDSIYMASDGSISGFSPTRQREYFNSYNEFDDASFNPDSNTENPGTSLISVHFGARQWGRPPVNSRTFQNHRSSYDFNTQQSNTSSTSRYFPLDRQSHHLRDTQHEPGTTHSDRLSMVGIRRSSVGATAPVKIDPVPNSREYRYNSENFDRAETKEQSSIFSLDYEIGEEFPSTFVCTDQATHWFAAERARQHAESHKSQIAAAFDAHGIQAHQYIVYAGFDEFLIQSGGGYLEQIHIVTSAGADQSSDDIPSSLLSDLGRIFSPFSAVLFTFSGVHTIPVFKADGSIWERDELIYHTARRFSVESLGGQSHSATVHTEMLPLSIAFSQSSSGSPSSSGSSSTRVNDSSGDASTPKKDKGKKKADDFEDDDMEDEASDKNDPESEPEGDPDANPKGIGGGKVVINIVSEIYTSHQQMRRLKRGDFQKLSMRGAFSVNASNKKYRMPSVDVRFTDLRFGSKPMGGDTSYNQSHLRVEVASGIETADTTGISPRRTFTFDRAVKDSSIMKTVKGVGGGISFSCGTKGINPSGSIGMSGAMFNERSRGLEKTRYLDQIAETSSDGTTTWEFTIDDPSAQAYGVHMPNDRLPVVHFRFPARTLPDRVAVSVVSVWSLVPCTPVDPQSQSWIYKLFHGKAVFDPIEMPVYSNLCQAVVVSVSPTFKGDYQHKKRMHVNAGNASLDHHSKTECIDPLTNEVDVKTDITNAIHKLSQSVI